MPIHVSSTCAHHQEVKIALHSLWYHQTYRWPSRAHLCDDTRGCVTQFWPPDDEHMCSKHVEPWNKLIVKQRFCASSWLITEMHGQQNIKIMYWCFVKTDWTVLLNIWYKTGWRLLKNLTVNWWWWWWWWCLCVSANPLCHRNMSALLFASVSRPLLQVTFIMLVNIHMICSDGLDLYNRTNLCACVRSHSSPTNRG